MLDTPLMVSVYHPSPVMEMRQEFIPMDGNQGIQSLVQKGHLVIRLLCSSTFR